MICSQENLLPPLEIVKNLVDLVKIKSIEPHNPVRVGQIPQPWQLLGTGNYAAVFTHPDYPEIVIKIYATGRSGWTEEVEVYRRLGYHKAFSQCFYAEANWLILKRLHGVTLYDCLHLGLKIPKQVIKDIDLALDYAKSQGLTPHDVHGRNVMMWENKGLVVDVSDFLQASPCWAWQDLKKAYYLLYLPCFSWHRLSVPYWLLDAIRTSYRFYRRVLAAIAKLL
ncbi:MAG: serine/threonine protein kinase [Cyanobacteria bacterium J083]|nr:MAG: serine/threonine protein kinase [Cyanobacteria bacterium J083]